MISPFKKMYDHIHHKVSSGESDLYTALLFPITFSFIITFSIARIVSHLAPEFYLEISPGLHIHHYTYGFFILAISGYLTLVFSGPRAKFWLALLFGIGLALSFDEFGMWLRLKDDEEIRLHYDGFNIIIGLIIFLLTWKHGLEFLKKIINRK